VATPVEACVALPSDRGSDRADRSVSGGSTALKSTAKVVDVECASGVSSMEISILPSAPPCKSTTARGCGFLLYCTYKANIYDVEVVTVSAKTGQELQEVLKAASKSVREKAKLAGAPLFYMQNGNRVREDADGRKYALVVDSEGKSLEFPIE